MRLTILLTVMLPALSFAGALTDAQLLEKVRQRATTLEQVTKEPHWMRGITALMCARPPAALVAEEKRNPHLNKFARLFVDKAGRPALEGHEPVHPEGTVIVKEKLPTSVAKAPELFTGMLKREQGYNPECGDWEFFTVSGDAKKLTDRGKLTSCMECHQRYPQKDFVTRYYVPERHAVPAADGSILLHARDAYVFGKQLRYEPQLNKNTLGYWTRKEDTAQWLFDIPKQGRYEVEILQGCGPGSGGAEVKVAFGINDAGKETGALKFTVEDTGGFQNFKPRVIGTVELPKLTRLALTVIPQTKPGAAVMDLRQIILRPVQP